MSFIDEVKIFFKAGDGGDGCVSFRREKFIEFGGPDGGNGGKGGSIMLVANGNLNTLLYFRYRQHIKAENGQRGSGRQRTGLSGEDLIIEVPLGTQVLDEDSEELICDLDKPSEYFIIARGGAGGVGNANYKSSVNRAPRHFTFGKEGEEKCLWLKLKIISDVGIIGFPNAGKSSFLTRCSRAKIKVADYPFTTLEPHLGVVAVGDDRELVIADIPGIIENAHLGIGLGHKFLKHIERCRVLLHLIDCTQTDIVNVYSCIRNELKLYNEDLAKKDEILVLNKCDLLDSKSLAEQKAKLESVTKNPVYLLSLNCELNSILNLLYKRVVDKVPEKEMFIYDPSISYSSGNKIKIKKLKKGSVKSSYS